MYHLRVCYIAQQEIQQAEELHKIIDIILESDRNHDFVLSDRELDRLFMRLEGFHIVNKERIKEALQRSSMRSSLTGSTVTMSQGGFDVEVVQRDPAVSLFGIGCGEADNSFMYRSMD